MDLKKKFFHVVDRCQCIYKLLKNKMRATIIDVMEWMINTQLGRHNLPPAQRISVVDKFKKNPRTG